jgi:hypothetical protein
MSSGVMAEPNVRVKRQPVLAGRDAVLHHMLRHFVRDRLCGEIIEREKYLGQYGVALASRFFKLWFDRDRSYFFIDRTPVDNLILHIQ